MNETSMYQQASTLVHTDSNQFSSVILFPFHHLGTVPSTLPAVAVERTVYGCSLAELEPFVLLLHQDQVSVVRELPSLHSPYSGY